MRNRFVITILPVFFLLVGCDYLEARRLPAEIEKDLGIQLSAEPKLLLNESYGWAEEGGDRSLVQLSAADCVTVGGRLREESEAMMSSEVVPTFQAAGLRPAKLSRSWEMNEQGDTKEYVLDASSCTLFREAHYE